MTKTPDTVAIVSGGLDSTALVYEMTSRGYNPHILSFDYGQRHKKELKFAHMTALQLNLPHDVIDLSHITHLIANSALTSHATFDVTGGRVSGDPDEEIKVPDGHYAEETMKATVVPNRNMMMISIAAAVAVSNRYRTIGVGVHGGDHFIYPDCRPGFILTVGAAILKGNDGFHNFSAALGGSLPIFAPFLNSTKADIAYQAIKRRIPLNMTWSCYKGGEKHCGRCGTCVERLEAIDQAAAKIFAETNKRFVDPTEYEDIEFWRTATREANRTA